MPAPDWPALLATGPWIVALLGIALTFWRTRPELRKVASATRLDDAQAGQASAESVKLLLGPLNTRIDELGDKVEALEAERDELKAGRAKREEEHTAEIGNLKAAQAAQQTEHAAEVGALRNEVDGLYGGIMVLVSQLEREHMTPDWKPKPKEKPKTGPLNT